MKNAQEKGKKWKTKFIGAPTYVEDQSWRPMLKANLEGQSWRPMLKTNVEDQLKQAENKQQQGATVTIHSSLLLSYIL